MHGRIFQPAKVLTFSPADIDEFFIGVNMKLLFIFLLIFLVYGCSFNSPLNTLYYETEKSFSQKNMIIFLRGRGGDHNDFESQGFVNEVIKRKLPYAMAAPNAHFGYYFGETLVSRLKIDIIEPAKLKGYNKFWLVGVSMGGFGSLIYAKQHFEDIEGICLISPFLGYEKIISEIGNLTVVELSEFLSEFEKTFNVSAAMPVAAAAAGQGQVAAAEEKLEFTVTLREVGPNKLNVMKALRQVKAGLGLIESKQMAENTPAVVGEKVPREDAKKWKEALEKEGAKVELS